MSRKRFLSHDLWVSQYGSDPQVLGKVIAARGDRYTVIGVMPPGFRYPEQSDLWVPLMARYAGYQAKWWQARSYRGHLTIARLRPGFQIEQARDEMTAMARQFEVDYPGMQRGVGYRLMGLRESETGGIRPYLWTLFGATAMVLLIGCLNAANLTLARSAAREKEIAIRAAIGAGRWPILRQLLVESILLSGAGGLLGILLSLWFLAALPHLVPVELPFWMKFDLNANVTAFSVGLSILTGIFFGLFPALQATRVDLHETLKQGGPRLQRFEPNAPACVTVWWSPKSRFLLSC